MSDTSVAANSPAGQQRSKSVARYGTSWIEWTAPANTSARRTPS